MFFFSTFNATSYLARYNLIIGATNNENFTRPFTEGRWDATVQLQPSGLQANRIYQPVSLTWSPANDPTLLSLTISVDDVIDEAPKFHRSEYVAAVLNDAQPDTFVIKVSNLGMFLQYFRL